MTAYDKAGEKPWMVSFISRAQQSIMRSSKGLDSMENAFFSQGRSSRLY